MSTFRVRAGALATTTGLVLMGAGAVTAQANGSHSEHNPTGTRPPCVSHDRGDVWQQTRPEGDGWKKVEGEGRLVPAVDEVEGQAFVPAVVGVPEIPQVEHTEYLYGRDVEGAPEVSPWLLEMPSQGDGYPWVQKDNRQADDPASTAPVNLVGGVLKVNYVHTEYVGTAVALNMYLKDPSSGAVSGFLQTSAGVTAAFNYSGSTFGTSPGSPAPFGPIVAGHVYNVMIAHPAGITLASLPVTATSGQHTEYQYGRFTKVHQDSEWLRAMPDGDGWVQTDNHQVIDHAAVPAVTAVAEIPFIAHVDGAAAYTEFNWTRHEKKCSTDGDDYTNLVLKLCHKTDSTYAVETITLRSTRDAHSIKGHAKDLGDIIPAFEFEGHSRSYDFPGRNDTDANLALLANDCKPPLVVVPTPPAVVVPAPVVAGVVVEAPAVVVSPAEAALPAAAAAGQVDTNGQLATGGLTGFAAFLMLGASFVLRRRHVKA